MGRVFAAGNLCGPSWPSPGLPKSCTSHPHNPQLSLGGPKGVNTSELSRERDGDTGGHNKRCGPRAVLTTGKSCHTAHTPQPGRASDMDRDLQTHTRSGVHRSQTGMCTDEDTGPDTMTQADRQNIQTGVSTPVLTQTHKLSHTHTHSHIQSLTGTHTDGYRCAYIHPGHSDAQRHAPIHT